MSLSLTILYRGTLSSCNYDCWYCPFGKHWESPKELAADRLGLERLIAWIADHHDSQLKVFFTPWGEALVRSWYRDAIVALSRQNQINRIVIQTNLSCDLDWLDRAKAEKLRFWCTYHPEQATISSFLKQCQRLTAAGVRHSVGCVGLREQLPEIQSLRQSLPDDTYMWINAYKSEPDYTDVSLADSLEEVDPLFRINDARHASLGKACRTGESVIAVDSRGDVRRCHFVDQVLGNLYDPGFYEKLTRRPCPNATCGCHIGYVHLEHLELEKVYGDGLLERVPTNYTAWKTASTAGAAAGGRSDG